MFIYLKFIEKISSVKLVVSGGDWNLKKIQVDNKYQKNIFFNLFCYVFIVLNIAWKNQICTSYKLSPYCQIAVEYSVVYIQVKYKMYSGFLIIISLIRVVFYTSLFINHECKNSC